MYLVPMKQLLLILLLLPTMAETQIISTVAGNGTSGYSGDGGAATAAKLNAAYKPVTDGAGNLYIADYGNNCIRMVDASGIITTVAGNGTSGYSGDGSAATLAKLSGPNAIAVDGAGNIYISDQFNYRIRKVNTLGIITTIAGNGTSAYGGDDGPATAARFVNINDITADVLGNVYLADGNNNRIRKVNTLGIITTIAGNGTGGYSGDGGAATAAKLAVPNGIAVDGMGNVYITDNSNSRIRKVDPTGIITTIAGNGTSGYGGDDGIATAAELRDPHGVAVDVAGNVYIGDFENYRIRKVNTDGVISTVAGNGTPGNSGDGGLATDAGFVPMGVWVDGIGNIFITDVSNENVRKVSVPNTTGITIPNIPKDKLQIWPNPASLKLNIIASEKIRNIEILNLIGQTICTHEYNMEKVQVDVANLPAGMYIVRINGSEMRKFVKE